MATASAVTNWPAGVGTAMTEQFADALNAQFKFVKRRVWAKPVEGLKYWTVMDTSRSSEKHSYVAASGVPPENRDVDRLPWQVPIQGFDNTYTPLVYRLGMAIERRLVETDQFNVVNKQMEDLNESARLCIELYAALPFNTSQDGTVEWVCADGMNLIDTARPYEDASQGTWANQETGGTITQARIGTMRLNFKKNNNEHGERAPLMMQKLVIPPDLYDTVYALTKSELKPGSSVNDENYIAGLKYEVWNYLTSTTRWFGMADESKRENHWYWGARPHIDIRDTDRGTDVFAKRLRMVFVTGADSPRALRGNAGA